MRQRDRRHKRREEEIFSSRRIVILRIWEIPRSVSGWFQRNNHPLPPRLRGRRGAVSFLCGIPLPGWVGKLQKEITHQSEYVNLARIYSMGERLRAERFQKAVLWKFATSFSSATIPDQAICELLEIVCTELPELSKENGLRDLVFWYAASKLSSLKKYNIFQKMMQEMPDLGRYICMRAGNGTSEPPRNEVKQPTSRFPAELDVCLPRNQLNSNLDC